MRVAVAGGTGVVGSHVVEALRRRGHEPLVMARSRGVDLVSGAGLTGALEAVDAVIDVLNQQTLSRRKARAFFTTTTERLLSAGQAAGVRHHVVLSIVGIDRVDTGYYAAKLAQEQLVRSGGVPFTILRATQFHEFPGQVLSQQRGPVAFVPRMRIQPVAAVEVGGRLAELAAGQPLGEITELAGPEVHDIVDLARRVAAHPGPGERRRRVVGVRLPGTAGRAMAAGALIPSGPATTGVVTFAEWLSGDDPR